MLCQHAEHASVIRAALQLSSKTIKNKRKKEVKHKQGAYRVLLSRQRGTEEAAEQRKSPECEAASNAKKKQQADGGARGARAALELLEQR
jgi:hypothetical protein